MVGIIPALAGNTSRRRSPPTRARDHPRACGEHVGHHLGWCQSEGIIPALAGNTLSTVNTCGRHWDHPRACGEHLVIDCAAATRVGSSPRLRGTRPLRRAIDGSWGIIPALAGNTGANHIQLLPQGDHPRACGEHSTPNTMRHAAWGSSPRLRGTLTMRAILSAICGIIPALAGNTTRFERPTHTARDHPRACGEHEVITMRVIETRGSSPRLRGTPPRYRCPSGSPRIIPALAGNTCPSLMLKRMGWDHPRACGEHYDTGYLMNGRPGSSPRLRGTHRAPSASYTPEGIIPALAGNTATANNRDFYQRDHPRACGEHGFA